MNVRESSSLMENERLVLRGFLTPILAGLVFITVRESSSHMEKERLMLQGFCASTRSSTRGSFGNKSPSSWKRHGSSAGSHLQEGEREREESRVG